jgi:hypothetical protein
MPTVRTATLTIALDPVELACRLMEANLQARRPPGMTPGEALASLGTEVANAEDHKHAIDAFYRMAIAAIHYLGEMTPNGTIQTEDPPETATTPPSSGAVH